MNTLLLEHFAAVSKIAAVRQSRERQQGVDCSQGYLGSTDAGLLFDGPRTLEVFFKYVPDSSSQFPIALSTSMMCFELSPSNVIRFFCGTSSLETPIVPNQDYHATISYDGSTAQAYLNGTLVGTITPKAYAVASSFRIGHVSYPPKGTIYFARIYNYALPAEEVAAHYNNGDPAGYVVPLADKYRWEASESNIGNIRFYPNNEGSGVTSYLEDNANGFTGRYAHIISGSSGLLSVYSYRFMGHPVGCVVEAKFKYRSNAPVRVLADNSSLPINMEDAADATIVYRTTGTNITGFSITVPNADANSWVEIQPVSLRTLGCIAEYLPQNLIVASKQDFPQVVFPDGVYTPGANVFGTNDPELTAITNDNPASHGFSGSFQRGEAIISLGIRCAFHNRSENIGIPIKLTVEYRSNISLYQYTGQGLSAEPLLESNEGDAKIATFVYGAGNGFLMGKSSVAGDWLEIRTLSIKVAEVAVLSWLDSAKQLPMNDEYLPPLLETAGGYNLTANGTPEIVYKPE